MSLKLSAIKKFAKMKESLYLLYTFYTVHCLSSFQLKIKLHGKSQRVRDKTYKVVNLISRCAGIISMDISTA